MHAYHAIKFPAITFLNLDNCFFRQLNFEALVHVQTITKPDNKQFKFPLIKYRIDTINTLPLHPPI